MSEQRQQTARELYLASLLPNDELAARRVAEKTGIPDNDPTWLLMFEVRRAAYETSRCTVALRQAASDAAKRIEQSGTSALVLNDVAVAHLANAAGAKVAEDDRVINALSTAVHGIETDARRAIHALESSTRDFVRQRIVTPAASLLFALLLGIAAAYLAILGVYHLAFRYGEELGYTAGFHYARIYDRSHR